MYLCLVKVYVNLQLKVMHVMQHLGTPNPSFNWLLYLLRYQLYLLSCSSNKWNNYDWGRKTYHPYWLVVYRYH